MSPPRPHIIGMVRPSTIAVAIGGVESVAAVQQDAHPGGGRRRGGRGDHPLRAVARPRAGQSLGGRGRGARSGRGAWSGRRCAHPTFTPLAARAASPAAVALSAIARAGTWPSQPLKISASTARRQGRYCSKLEPMPQR